MSEPNTGFYPLPMFAAAYPEPPSTFSGNLSISLLARAPEGVLKQVVPELLTPLGDLFLINWSYTRDVRGTNDPETPFLRDVYVIEFVAAVDYKGERGGHCFLEYTYPAESAMIGREIWGWPKKVGNFVWEDTANGYHLEVHRNGVKLIQTDFELGDPDTIPGQGWPDAFNEPYLHVRRRIGRNGQPTYADVLRVPVEELSSEPGRSGTATVSLADGEGDPLSILGSVEILDARMDRNDFIFHYGDVIDTVEIPHPATPAPVVTVSLPASL